MDFLLKISKWFSFTILAMLIMVITLTPRLINLDYNSAFNDEAVYVIVGSMGIFEKDWWTYNASSWIPGVQYFYPSITAISYNLYGGIVGSRFINVLLGVLLVETIFILTATLYYKLAGEKVITGYTMLAGVVGALVVGGSEVSHYVSRLATYDMPSFAFLFLGLLALIHSKPVTSGRRYFYAALFLSLSYLTKIITGIFIPFIVIYFYFYAKKLGPQNLVFWKKYFLIPVLIVFIIFLLISFDSLFLYYNTQQALVKGEVQQISQTVWESSKYVWAFWFVGTIGMFLKKQFHAWSVLTFAALWVVCFHLASSRTLSIDKHIVLTISFLGIVAGLGASNIISLLKLKSLQVTGIALLILTLGTYWFISYEHLEKFNNQWENLAITEKKMSEVVKQGDKVLAESGSAIILATYEKNYPPNTTTFDWLEYRGVTGEEAFENAVRDGYFDIIQLEAQTKPKSDANAKMSLAVKNSMQSNYKLVFNKDGFYIYQRAF